MKKIKINDLTNRKIFAGTNIARIRDEVANKVKIAETIANATDQAKAVGNVGIHLMKFCSKHDLVRIRDNVKFYAEPFNARFYQDQAVAG